MGSKQKIRQAKRLRRQLRKIGACKLCGPSMLLSPADGAERNKADGLCPGCDKPVRFNYSPGDARSERALDLFIEHLFASGQYCAKTYRITSDGKVIDEKVGCDDSCDLNHVELIFRKPGEGRDDDARG
jgi:hypothetical protein